ncbi:uncharacterized protein MELLADRAFT_69478 [Melampsora larici-populina 98AG31]|uniref:Uncharacterized protein n=1 Tax=Melampsora larici-populina (strain 98AG31 / pathotype 3-4-7) TaxID=747676 RepID=F4SAW4_MELLP|nr:uncharacterized protein MELLADRAFT_69478 [Melampsora larici-populina 98AG31]EGF98177.1 hypothetical protein MELLADRAFT_69478 [Melampsora larici-populina 98AG31]
MPREIISLPQPSPRKLRSRVVPKKRTPSDQDSTSLIPATSSGPGPIHNALQNVGVNVGANTQRDRLLAMLSRHLIRKKPRMSAGIVPDITPKFSGGKPPKRDTLDCNPLDEGRFHTPRNDVNELNADGSFSQFGDHDLVKMIRGVGIDAEGWDREKLITTCQEYNELIVIPDNLKKFFELNGVVKQRELDPVSNVLTPQELSKTVFPSTQPIVPFAGPSDPRSWHI